MYNRSHNSDDKGETIWQTDHDRGLGAELYGNTCAAGALVAAKTESNN